MADKLIFPIGFDLEKGIQEAQGDADRLLRRLEMQIKSRPLAVNLRINGAGDGSINSINSRIKELVDRWNSLTEAERVASKTSGEYTVEAKKILAEYTRLVGASESYARTLQQISSAARRSANEQEKMTAKQRAAWEKLRRAISANENTIDGLNAKIKAYQQRLNGLEVGSKKFEKTAEKIRQLSIKLDEAKKKVAELTGKMAASAPKQAQAVNQVNQELKNQDGYVSRLLKRMAVYAGFSQISSFLTNVRQVTAEFELQRVSLGAIIQDQAKANALFSEIKQFALKSPISILDLTKYTKQVAAYRVGVDELFDTTKRLADVSVGLGVSMDRIVLAYGQVKAATYLRAAEVRQFTEAGIPMLELVAEKLSKMNGEMVTTEQAMQTISERGVGFEVVKEIFEDMTSAGGMFYNMQEKQGNTLYGLWAKLGDAASVMYDEIGNSGPAQWVMKGMINSLTDLMRNWGEVSRYIGVAGVALTTYMLTSKLGTVSTVAAAKATRDYARAQVQLNTAKKQGDKMSIIAASASARVAAANRAAAMTTNIWTAAKYRLVAATNSLKAALATNWITVAATAVLALANAIYSAWENAHRLDNALGDIKSEMTTLQTQSVRNFEYLAENAVKAANGTKEQKDALDELNRTYKDILPQEALKLENLRKLHGDYSSLTTAIKEYIAAQQKEKAINAIGEEYGKKITENEKLLREMFKKGFDMSDIDIDRFFVQFKKLSTDASLTLEQKVTKAFDNIGKKLTSSEKDDLFETVFGVKTGSFAILDDLNNAMVELEERINGVRKEYSLAAGDLGEFSAAVENVNKTMVGTRFIFTSGKNLDPDSDSYLLSQMQTNAWIKSVANELQTNQDIQQAFALMGESINSEWFKIVERLKENDLGNISEINFDAILKKIDEFIARLGNKNPQLTNSLIQLRSTVAQWQEQYKKMVPSDFVVKTWRSRWQQIVDSTKVSTNFIGQHLMQAGESFADYRKRIKDEIKKLLDSIEIMRQSLAMKASLKKVGAVSEAEYAKAEQELKKYQNQATELQKLYKELDKVELSGDNKKKGKSSAGKSKTTKSSTKKEGVDQVSLLKQEAAMVKSLYEQYEKLRAVRGPVAAKDTMEETFKDTLAKLKKRYGIELPTTIESAIEGMQRVHKELGKLIGSTYTTTATKTDKKGKTTKTSKSKLRYPNAQKDFEELGFQIEEMMASTLQKRFENAIKRTADEISRVKTAKELYEAVMTSIGDESIAEMVSRSFYGSTGEELQKELADQIREIVGYAYKDATGATLELPVDIVLESNHINYKKLLEWVEKNEEQLGEKQASELKKIAQNGQKDWAQSYKGYLKDIEKAKTYADKRVELAQTTAKKINEIQQQMVANPEFKDEGQRIIDALLEAEIKEEGKLEWEAFKELPIYVQMFGDLENASTSALTTMRNRLEGLSGKWNIGLTPQSIKEIQSQMRQLEEQLRARNPFKELIRYYKQMQDIIKNNSIEGLTEYVDKKSLDKNDALLNPDNYTASEIAKREEEYEIARRLLEITIETTDQDGKRLKGVKALAAVSARATSDEYYAQQKLNTAVQEMEEAKILKGEHSEEYKKLKEEVARLTREYNRLAKVAEIAQGNSERVSDWKLNIKAAAESAAKWTAHLGEAARAAADIANELGADEYDVEYLNSVADGLENITGSIEDIVGAAMEFNIHDMITSVLTAIPKMVTGFSQLFNANRIRKANKEIERQQELLDQLEYSYSRLQSASEKLFGVEYIRNYDQQLYTLRAQANAYQKQLEAEKSKGKKANKERIKEYENAYRDTMDEIADMQGQIAEQMLGTDLTSAARDFAKAWLDAYKQFGNTADAMSEKFHEMIENMVVESLLARAMQRALEPAFKMIDEYNGDFMDAGFWEEVMSVAEQGAKDADAAGKIIMDFAKQWGYNGRDTDAEFTGIKRGVANASSEEMNANTSALNTQNYYISQIHSNVADIAALLRSSQVSAVQCVDYTPLIQQSLENQAMMVRNTAETVAECRNIAAKCQAQTDILKKIISPKNADSTHRLNVYMRN